DCPVSVEDPTTGCVGLPAQTFQYTDAGSGSHWSATSAATWAPPFDFVSAGSAQWPNGYDLGVRMGDVNGDGLVDLVRAWCATADYPCNATNKGIREVWLNTGSGWVKDTYWSQQLDGLAYNAPTLTVQTRLENPTFSKYTICDAV